MTNQMNVTVNMRLNTNDAEVLKSEAEKLRMPFSAYCRHKLTKDIK